MTPIKIFHYSLNNHARQGEQLPEATSQYSKVSNKTNNSLVSLAEPEEGVVSDFFSYVWNTVTAIFAFVIKPFVALWNVINFQSGIAMTKPISRDVIDFYRGNTANTEGVSLAEILAWDDTRLEAVHNYIQWLFPSKSQSAFNANAPVLNPTIIQAFRKDPALRKNLLQSLHRMLSFYGLKLDESNMQITRTSNAGARQSVWLSPGNHNFLRITRILSCLSALGLKPYAKVFLNALTDIYNKEGKPIISAKTFAYWKNAIKV